MFRRATLTDTPPLRRHLARFARDEGGSLMMFGLFLFVLMIMLGGLAVDLMRYEQRRTALQQTIDRSVLAAAALTQDLDPKAVVNDYFAKANLSQFLRSVTVTEGLNFRNVHAKADAELDPYFTHMVGIDEFEVPAGSEAEQRITNVEIVMVLDVSGSMTEASGSTTKIAALKSAAKKFVDAVKTNDVENRISIAIVPYNAQVNVGSVLRQKFTFTHDPVVTNVNCLEVPASTYGTATLSRTLSMPMSAYADMTGTTNQTTSFVSATDTNYSKMNTGNPFCRNTAANIVRLPSGTTATIKSQIDALVAAGNTSIMLGMKWGLTLIDPGARPMYNELIAAGQIPAAFSGRPFNWVTEDSMKVIIVMTDGDHVEHTYVKDAYKTGISPIWKSSGDGNFSIRFTGTRPTAAGTNQYWVPHLCTSNNCKNGTNTGEAWKAAAWNSGSGTTNLTWNGVWANQRLSWVAWQLYARALGSSSATRTTQYNTAMDMFRGTFATEGAMDSQLQQSCTLAKNNKVVVYGIAFEAPANGQAQISQCATSLSHYWDANGLEIESAFQAIASNISQLRLTQ